MPLAKEAKATATNGLSIATIVVDWATRCGCALAHRGPNRPVVPPASCAKELVTRNKTAPAQEVPSTLLRRREAKDKAARTQKAKARARERTAKDKAVRASISQAKDQVELRCWTRRVIQKPTG